MRKPSDDETRVRAVHFVAKMLISRISVDIWVFVYFEDSFAFVNCLVSLIVSEKGKILFSSNEICESCAAHFGKSRKIFIIFQNKTFFLNRIFLTYIKKIMTLINELYTTITYLLLTLLQFVRIVYIRQLHITFKHLQICHCPSFLPVTLYNKSIPTNPK